jgi:hypothetical protein
MRKPVEPIRDRDATGKVVELYNPLTAAYDIKFEGPRSLYRTQTLVSIWATAPYLHSNSVGTYTGDPTIAGRMIAFQDGMTKLLWPERRACIGSIKTTEHCSVPEAFGGLEALLPGIADKPGVKKDLLTIPAGTPIDLFANVHPKDLPAVLETYVAGVLHGRPAAEFIPGRFWRPCAPTRPSGRASRPWPNSLHGDGGFTIGHTSSRRSASDWLRRDSAGPQIRERESMDV